MCEGRTSGPMFARRWDAPGRWLVNACSTAPTQPGRPQHLFIAAPSAELACAPVPFPLPTPQRDRHHERNALGFVRSEREFRCSCSSPYAPASARPVGDRVPFRVVRRFSQVARPFTLRTRAPDATWRNLFRTTAASYLWSRSGSRTFFNLLGHGHLDPNLDLVRRDIGAGFEGPKQQRLASSRNSPYGAYALAMGILELRAHPSPLPRSRRSRCRRPPPVPAASTRSSDRHALIGESSPLFRSCT